MYTTGEKLFIIDGFLKVKTFGMSCWHIGLEIASLDPHGTGTAWPLWFSPSRSRLAPRVVEDTLMTLGSFGERQVLSDTNENPEYIVKGPILGKIYFTIVFGDDQRESVR